MIESLFILILLAALAWYWQDGLKAREIGVAAARQACQKEGLQFLDDTVAQSGLRLRRDDYGQMRLQRSFAFEYSYSGDDRASGSVTLLGHELIMLDTGPSRSQDDIEMLN